MPTRLITYFGKTVVVGCDGKCDKAWGINNRPSVQISADDDDYAFLADDELGTAPENPGTYEGGYGKDPLSLNKWCVRECERHAICEVHEDPKLPDYSKRLYNIRSSDPNRHL
jgi:hypothetical protein